MVIVSDILLPKNADGILKVSDVSTSADSDLSARTDITNPDSSIFVKTDASGRLNILESNIEGAGADNSLNATEYPVHQVGAFDGSSYRSIKCNSKGFLTNIMNGNTNPDGVSGDTHAIHVDSNGNIRVSTVSTVNTAPANSANSSVEVSPSNSFAVGLTARQDIGVASQTPLLCDAQGHLKTDIVNTANVKFEDISSSLNSGTADNPPNSLAVGMRGRTNIGSQATETFVKVNTLGELVTALPSKTELDVFTVGERTVTGASVTSTNTLELKGTGKVCITIHADTSNHSAIVKLSNDGTNFFSPTSGATFNPSGTGFLLVAEFDNIAKLAQVTYSNTSGGTAVISAAKLVY